MADNLLSVLNQTDLQRDDPKLYQVLKGLIDRPIAVPPIPPNVEVYNIDTRNSAQTVYLSAAIKEGVFYIITDMFGNAGTNNITLKGVVSGITDPKITSDYGVIKVYSDINGYQFWGGTAAGTFGPGNPDTSVQYNDNGIFGGSDLYYDKTKGNFSFINPVPVDFARFWGEYINSGPDPRWLLEFDYYPSGAFGASGGGAAISGYTGVDGGSYTGSATGVDGSLDLYNGVNVEYAFGFSGSVQIFDPTDTITGAAAGVAPFARQFDGLVELLTSYFGNAEMRGGTATRVECCHSHADLFDGTVTTQLISVNATARIRAGTTDEMVGINVILIMDDGSVNKSYGIRIYPPDVDTVIPIEAYGLIIGDQTIAGMADPDKNWAMLIYGSGHSFGVKATGIPSVNGNDGVSGIFTTADAKTVTVENGIITSIV